MKNFLSILFCFLIFWACENNDKKPNLENKPEKEKIDREFVINGNLEENDTLQTLDVVKNLKPTIAKQMHFEEPISFERFSEMFSDSKMNGEAIIIQMNMAQSVFDSNHDTIECIVNNYYGVMEPYFPRSIADDFESGTSTEHISYPTLNFCIELFENEYSLKPYRVINRIVSKEKAKVGNNSQDIIYDRVDQMPTISMDNLDISVFFINSEKFPEEDIYESVSGISWISFIVEKDGSISDLCIEKESSECKKCDIEALRIARSLPLLNPGKIGGEPVRVRIVQGIRF
jgi:hypothetical protein